jgi:hypothetical protein
MDAYYHSSIYNTYSFNNDTAMWQNIILNVAFVVAVNTQ